MRVFNNKLLILLSLFAISPAFSAEMKRVQINIGDSELILHYDFDKYSIGAQPILDWVEKSAKIVAGYYGVFPVSRVNLFLNAAPGGGVQSGRAYGRPALRVVIGLGYDISQAQLDNDWKLVHELIHLAFPDVAYRHRWLVEGLPTYIESIARVQAGDLDEKTIWEGFIKGMPNGLPMAGDLGLDFTPTWGRTYWGGAIFCFIADLEIRTQTNSQLGLQDAMQAVMEAGLTLNKRATIEQIIKIADKRTSTTVFNDLYNRMKDKPEQVNLKIMWENLGVNYNGNSKVVTIDNSAPMALIRKSILMPRKGL